MVMKPSLLFVLLVGFVLNAGAVSAFAQLDTLWKDDFSDGNYTSNWTWTMFGGTAQIANGACALQGSFPDASCEGDPANRHPNDRYGYYVDVRIEGTGTPALYLNVKDNASVFWLVELYPPNKALWFLRGEYPNPAGYVVSATLADIILAKDLRVRVDISGDTLRAKVWPVGDTEPANWHLKVDTAKVSVPWSGLRLGGWWLDNALITFDNVVCYAPKAATPVEPDPATPIVREFALLQNYPNPFNPSTTIKFELPKASQVSLTVYDVLGREVSVLVNEKRDGGVHEVRFDGSNLASGVYLYRIQAADFVQTRKLLLLR